MKMIPRFDLCQATAKCVTLLYLVGCTHFVNSDPLPKRPNNTVLSHQVQVSAIDIDGQLNEPMWQLATQVSLDYENIPGDGIQSPVKTQAYLYEDGDSLYVAIVASDPQPELIRSYLRDRDSLWNDDYVGIILDTFNDQRGAYQFFVNPLGVQADARMDDSNGWRDDNSWDAIWESAANVDQQGWTVEIRIPFSALRFATGDGEKTWRFALIRNYPRDQRHYIASYRSDRAVKCSLCQFDTLTGLSTAQASQNIQLTPTITLAQDDRKTGSDAQWHHGDLRQEIGLDLRWGISQDSVLNATINPDFSQIEADASQVDVNKTFSLFVRETRPFFLDGADHFNTNGFNLAHTRNIADPEVGVKLTGKNGEHSYGLLVANDQQTTFLLPNKLGSSVYDYQQVAQPSEGQSDLLADKMDSQIAIASYQADLGGRNNIGVVVTHRQATGYANNVVSLDGNYHVSQSDNIEYQVVNADSKNPTELQQDFGLNEQQRDLAYSLNYYHDDRELSYNLGYESVGEDFRADMGFVGQVDYRQLSAGGQRSYYGEPATTFNKYGYFANASRVTDQGGNLLSQSLEVYGFAEGPMQFYGNLGVAGGSEFYQDQADPVGETFHPLKLTGYSTLTPQAGLRLDLSFNWGDQIDYANAQLGQAFNLWATVNWQLDQHLSANLNYYFDTMKVEHQRLFSANKVDLRLTYQFNVQSQLKLVVQYTDIDRDPSQYHFSVNKINRFFATQLLYSYKLNPQSLVYLGYSDGGYQNDFSDGLARDHRSIFAKFSYAWQQ